MENKEDESKMSVVGAKDVDQTDAHEPNNTKFSKKLLKKLNRIEKTLSSKKENIHLTSQPSKVSLKYYYLQIPPLHDIYFDQFNAMQNSLLME